MCSYVTHTTDITANAKGQRGWFPVTQASVYLDHPYVSAADHTLNIDFMNRAQGAAARVAVEMTPESARALIACIESALTADASSV